MKTVRVTDPDLAIYLSRHAVQPSVRSTCTVHCDVVRSTRKPEPITTAELQEDGAVLLMATTPLGRENKATQKRWFFNSVPDALRNGPLGVNHAVRDAISANHPAWDLKAIDHARYGTPKDDPNYGIYARWTCTVPGCGYQTERTSTIEPPHRCPRCDACDGEMIITLETREG